jgi:catechol 2,3-dioxygenase-like lactoylglutathione lyase family enzyme
VLRVLGIDHVVFTVADVEASAAWYCDRLGMEVLRLDEWRRGEVPFVSLRISDTTLIDLIAGDRSGQNVDHVSLCVEGSLDDVVASGRFDVVHAPFDIFGAQGVGPGMYVRDPDGNVIELKTYPAG